MNSIHRLSLWPLAVLLVLTSLRPLCAAESDKNIRISVAPKREGAVYKTGELVRFRIDVKDGEGRALDWGSVRCMFSDDHYQTTEDFSMALTGEPLEVSGKLDRPGFLQCEVRFQPGNGTLESKVKPGLGAAAVSPEAISPSREVPVDFEAFWESQKQHLAEVPIEAEMSKMADASTDGIEVFDTQVASLDGVPVSGYFARPSGATNGSLPIVLWVHGAGVVSASVNKAVKGAKAGFLSMDINAHGIANGQPKAFYEQLKGKNGRLLKYPHQGRENRDGVYFKGMFLRLVRAIDFLVEQPEWDGKTVAVIGHSQGGAQALVAGGLDDRVTFIGAGVPAMCDHTGMLRKRISGWPKLVPVLPDGSADSAIAEVARYYDAVNFAARCHAEAILSAGFIDRTCPPTSVYAAYNQLKGKKQIIDRPAMGHAAPADIQKAFFTALQSHVAKKSGGQNRK